MDRMAKTKGPKTADVVFEGVLIPKGTRSARLASKGVNTIDEMGDFLTAVFNDTLKGKIVLPSKTASPLRVKIPAEAEHKLKRGLPVSMQGKDLRIKRPRRAKVG
jgi:hypothetical protein